tara:strand:+ start:4784 stop:4978 length:195 start_codon:yes stop_codon:yes gene_type:complete
MNIDKIISMVRSLREEAVPVNNVGSGNIAGTREAGDDPPVNQKKKKRYVYGGRGSRRMWLGNNG